MAGAAGYLLKQVRGGDLNYVSSLLAKLGMQRRTQAAVLATRLHDAHERWQPGQQAR
jgi:hypothetical protein